MNIASLLKKQVQVAGFVGLIGLGVANSAAAQVTVDESGEAGETVEDAQFIPSGSANLDSITGEITELEDADLFSIFIHDPQGFSASTVGGADFDTQLFLFNNNGIGVEFNDNTFPTFSLQSTLPPANPNSPASPGRYLLGISEFDIDPETAAGQEIFPDGNFPFNTGVFGPDVTDPLDSFNADNDVLQGGAYEISLTGANAVPEPASILGLLTFGSFTTSAWLKHQRKKRQN
ncbi:hypothetical protein IQ255_17995 [Pleurocapsales cyanobacterium LEGE 10410]|nr:hypothetical protein [Pleurocapsales cyanobacterium LEGE 10410]